MIEKKLATVMVILGVTGDLARRKLLPAISELIQAGVVGSDLRIIGITRKSDVKLGDFLDGVNGSELLIDKMELFQMDLANEDEYVRLDERLVALQSDIGEETQRLFYLSVPPQVSRPIVELMGKSGISGRPRTKLLLEKPFGVDLESAKELVEDIGKYFDESQVYRIDHYLAKEMTQHLVVFRDRNFLFKNTWNRDFIERIEIIASEQIGIEGRGSFYEQTGAMRDLVQSHLLQLAALALMDLPQKGQMEKVPARRLAALKKLRVANNEGVWAVKRGQYDGYREEAGNDRSRVETFVAFELESSDERWQGVPIVLATGKAMNNRETEIRIVYRSDVGQEPNELIMRLQPDEQVSLCLLAKKPGYEHKVERRALHFSYREEERLPEAYEKVILDAMESDHDLFATSDEILETWRILDPIQESWAFDESEIAGYERGSDIRELLSM